MLASILGIVLVGSTVALSTFTGLTLKDVAELQLQGRVEQQSRAVAVRAERMRQSQSVIGIVQSIARDLSAKSACEKKESCLSLKPKGGRGEVARTVEILATRATDISSQSLDKKAEGEAALVIANGLITEFADASSKAGEDIWSRRNRAELIDARLRQTLSTIDEATLATIVSAFRTELASGIVIDGDPETTRRVNAILKSHSESLAQVGAEEVNAAELAGFPPRPGVWECTKYLPQFWTIASLMFVIEIGLPLFLLWFAYLTALTRYDVSDPTDDANPYPLRTADGQGFIAISDHDIPEDRPVQSRKRIGHDV